MDREALTFSFSPCPNDTFAFFALVHGLVSGPIVRPMLADIDTLNRRAEEGVAEVTKISLAAFAHLRTQYVLLRSGGTCGYGIGPVVVTRSARRVGGRVAIPGERTTAALLLRLLGIFDTVPMKFDKIEEAILSGDVDLRSPSHLRLLAEALNPNLSYCPVLKGCITVSEPNAFRCVLHKSTTQVW